MASVNINSSEVLKHFRHKWIKFDDECRQALAAVKGDVNRVAEWLRREQMAYWKRELQNREAAVQQARLDVIRASSSDKYHGKSSAVDERKFLEKALRKKEEAEGKIINIKKWCTVIDSKAGKLLAPCASFASQLENMTPKLLHRLDVMIDSLDDYARAASESGGGGGGGASGGESGDGEVSMARDEPDSTEGAAE